MELVPLGHEVPGPGPPHSPAGRDPEGLYCIVQNKASGSCECGRWSAPQQIRQGRPAGDHGKVAVRTATFPWNTPGGRGGGGKLVWGGGGAGWGVGLYFLERSLPLLLG